MTFNGNEFDDDFDNTEAHTGLEQIPPGTYQVRIDRATFEVPDWEGAEYPRLNLECKVIGGERAGGMVFPNADCNPEYIKYLKGMLVKLGFNPPPKPSEISGRLEEMIDMVLEVKVVANKKNPEYPKVYINRFVCMFEAGMDDGPANNDVDPSSSW